jgi:predicted lipoprotein with Yx(FWY)xxD motif
MKRSLLVLCLMLAGVATSASALASQSSHRASAHVSRAAKIELRHTGVGAILVSSSGATLYEFTRDHGHNSCVAIKGCAELWPALQSSSKPTAGSGVRASLLSTVKLSGGGEQVTYAGHPLYLYSAGEPGSTSYVGFRSFGGTWDAINAAGHAVK